MLHNLLFFQDEKDLWAGMQTEIPDGTPKFTWLKNGKAFNPEERFKVLFRDDEDSLALVFQNVKPEDAGLYTCIASTCRGKISCSAELNVQGKVTFYFIDIILMHCKNTDLYNLV